jgi:hypothetical protein
MKGLPIEQVFKGCHLQIVNKGGRAVALKEEILILVEGLEKRIKYGDRRGMREDGLIKVREDGRETSINVKLQISGVDLVDGEDPHCYEEICIDLD